MLETAKHKHCINVFNVSSGVVMVTKGYNLLWKIWNFSVDREPWQGLDYPVKAADSCTIINFQLGDVGKSKSKELFRLPVFDMRVMNYFN